MKLKKFHLSLGLIALIRLTTLQAEMVVNRGLPTSNLNSVNANRSNVRWAYPSYTPTDYDLVGDSFMNTSLQTWNIDKIRLWTTDPTDPTGTTTLWGGIEGSTISVVSALGSISSVAYTDGNTYQDDFGTYNMHQVDFAVIITLEPGQIYDFFLDGSRSSSDPLVPFLHASHAALSGSPQEGSDDLLLFARVLNGSIVPASVGSWTSQGNGWDKASDMNMQVFTTQVPEPTITTMLLVALLFPIRANMIRAFQSKKRADNHQLKRVEVD